MHIFLGQKIMDLGRYFRAKKTQITMMRDRGYLIDDVDEFLLSCDRQKMTQFYSAMQEEIGKLGMKGVNGQTFHPQFMSKIYLKKIADNDYRGTFIYYTDGGSFDKKEFDAIFNQYYMSFRQGPSASGWPAIFRFLYPSEISQRVLLTYGEKLDNVIFILSGALTSGAGGTKELVQHYFGNKVRVTLFSLIEMMANPQHHNFAPIFYPLSPLERQKYMTGKKASQIPVFRREVVGATAIFDDPQAKIAGWEEGQIVRIVRQVGFLADVAIPEICTYRMVTYSGNISK